MATVSYHRERVREQLQREIGMIISNEMRDPRIPPLVTVTDVRLGADLRNATVGISMPGDEKERKGALIALNNAAAYVQHLLSSRIVLKFMPKLYFKFDKSLEHSAHIHELLKEIKDDLV
jgi:ribosome-binding factor A